MKDSPLYRFLKLGGGKINASLDSPTDTTYVQKQITSSAITNSDMRRVFLSQEQFSLEQCPLEQGCNTLMNSSFVLS